MAMTSLSLCAIRAAASLPSTVRCVGSARFTYSRYEAGDPTQRGQRPRSEGPRQPSEPGRRYHDLMSRLIDLSHPIEAGMTTYPGMPGPVITDYLSRADSRARYDAGTEFSIGRIEMIANTGTYLDTPFHRFESGFDLAGLALEKVADLPGTCLRVAGPELG